MNEDCELLVSVMLDIRKRLERAANDRRSPMHMPVLATADGVQRIVVLRACDAQLAALRIHTDARSPKAATIGQGAAVGLLGFDPETKIQIRARGWAKVETTGPTADAAWAEASAYARRCYLAEAAPGTPVAQPVSGLPADVEGIRPNEEQLLPARANFAVIMIELTQLDWLHLAHAGHRRARFERETVADEWQGTWVVP